MPALAGAVKDRDVAVRLEALQSLQRMGPAARDALPAIVAAQKDADSRVRTISSIDIGDGWEGRARCHLITIAVTANGFLRYMVRSIAGTLLAVGRDEIDQSTVARAIDEGKRELVGPTAPARGLTMKSVAYD